MKNYLYGFCILFLFTFIFFISPGLFSLVVISALALVIFWFLVATVVVIVFLVVLLIVGVLK
jgi:hypothetical protein